MKPQEIFDTVAKHVFAQGERAGIKSPNGNFSCQYRTPTGKKCAAGALLPDEYYHNDMEGTNWQSICQDGGFLIPDWMAEHSILIDDLQTAHDTKENWKSVNSMKTVFRQIAQKYNLSDKVLENLAFKSS